MRKSHEYCSSRYVISYLTNVAIAILLRKTADIALYVRWFIQTYQFRSDTYRLYYLALGTSQDAINQFRHANDQRYLLRQIKALDGVLSGRTTVGSAAIQEDTPEIPKAVMTRHHPLLFMLYGHRLAVGGSYAPAQSPPPGYRD
jgi:general transcription factor 3C polypeptide 3 (transcription factor C subunit 4)